MLYGSDCIKKENDMGNVMIMEHPLIKYKITLLRDKNTRTMEFRNLIEEITMLEAYEAFRNLPLKNVEVETPIEKCISPMIDGKKMVIIPILRAGMGMVNGVHAMVPAAKVGHIGLARNEVTHEPESYYCKLPSDISERLAIVLDPMLATGGSAVAAVNYIKEAGGTHIKFMCIIAAPEGLEKLAKAHPDIEIYVGNLDRGLNENAYICPGLGDAGDRIYGTLG